MKRLKDTDADVRMAALSALSLTLLDDPCKLSAETVSQVFDRVKDRNFDVRKLASDVAGKTYYKHVSSIYIAEYIAEKKTSGILLDTLIQQYIPSNLWERLHTVPELIVNCWGFPENESKNNILKVRFTLQCYLYLIFNFWKYVNNA
jgi:hypothetical protein